MKIGIFGVTRGVGLECVKQALEQGNFVTVLARNKTPLLEIKS